ncbi:MAG: DUF2269 family protein [Methyloceanibacter sp.]
MSYLAFKVVHLLGVVLFLGNIIVTGVWKTLADQTREPPTIAYAQRLVTITDWVFTLGGIVLILIGAYGMVAAGGLDPLGTCVYRKLKFGRSGDGGRRGVDVT